MLTIILQEDNVLLNEVVVVGYGTIKRANLSGVVSTVDSKIFESRPVQNAAAALQGEMSGVLITRSGGTPGGEDINIRVRDISSINGGSPLVLIDGAEGSLNSINPADIATISVLKDGNAAIYGARAADGVILVTTKSGRKNQALKVSLDAYYAFRKPALLKKTVNLYQYAEMGLEITDGSWTPEYTREDLPKIAANSPEVIPNGIWEEYPKFFQSVDWRDELVGNGNMESYNISMSGGGQSYDYLVSLGYQNENGLPKYGKDNNKRYFVRAKSNIELSRNVNFDLNLSYDVSDRDYSTQIDSRAGVVGNLWESMFKMKCWAPVYNPAGGYYTFQYYSNLAQALEEMGTKQTSNINATLNGKLNWKILDELTLTGQAIVKKQMPILLPSTVRSIGMTGITSSLVLIIRLTGQIETMGSLCTGTLRPIWIIKRNSAIRTTWGLWPVLRMNLPITTISMLPGRTSRSRNSFSCNWEARKTR